MDLDLTDDQEALRTTLRELFDKESPVDRVRAAEPSGFDAGLWRLVADMGIPAIAVPEERGGGGAGFVELAIACELLGRSLAPIPLIETAVANTLLASMAGEPAAALVDDAVSGHTLATLALHPVHDGVARLVPAGAVADVVVARRGDELVAVRSADKPAVLPNLGSMPVAHVPVDGADTVVLATGAEAVAAHRRAVGHWELLTAAALVGITSRSLELGIDYVLQRRAFGVLIANFQTIQHHLADNATALEGARLLAYKAAWAEDAARLRGPNAEATPGADTLATAALLFASETAFTTASDSLHFHGGYGYTLEYDIQLYFRRAKAWPQLAGDRRAAYAGLAHRLFDETEG